MSLSKDIRSLDPGWICAKRISENSQAFPLQSPQQCPWRPWLPGIQAIRTWISRRKNRRLCGKIQLRNGIGPCSKKKSKPDLEIRDFAIQVKSKCLRFCRRKVLYGHIYVSHIQPRNEGCPGPTVWCQTHSGTAFYLVMKTIKTSNTSK